MPIIEIMVIIAVGQAIGGWPTFLLLVATSLLGAWLITREGGRAWRALDQALRSGRMPARELADGVVVLVGGTLLLVPGFVTDVARPRSSCCPSPVRWRGRCSRRSSARRLVGPGRASSGATHRAPTRPAWEQQEPPEGRAAPTSSDEVVEGEIIDED